MTPLVPIMLYGWLPVSLAIFRELRGHRGLICCFVLGTLFLPEHTYMFGGIPDYSKSSAIAYGAIAGALLFETKTVARFRMRLYDLPIIFFCLIPIGSAVSNDLTIMDGVNLSISTTFQWGIPYFLGRIFLTSFESLRSAAYGIFLGGLIYIPFCLYEVRMSPQLNKIIYGFQYGTWSIVRYGGFRPKVFLRDGLDIGLWMTAAALLGICVYRFRLVRRVYGIKIEYLLAVLVVTTILCKATGALLLLIAASCVLHLWQKTRWRLPFLIMVMSPICYIGVRATGIYDFSHVVATTSSLFGEDRAQSLQFRFDNEDMLISRALEAPVLGWTGFGRNRVRNETGKVVSITDGYWIILFGTCGIVGLATFYACLLIIPTLCFIRFSSRRYKLYDVGALVALCVFTVILSIDCLLNAFWTSVYPLCLGGLTAVYVTKDSKLFDEDYLDDQHEVEIVSPKRLWPPSSPDQQPQLTS